MGMDWHSYGITTSVIGALKRGRAPLELGIHVCGGRGIYKLAWFKRLASHGRKRCAKMSPSCWRAITMSPRQTSILSNHFLG
jgi:hypothetical protein